MAAKAKVTSVAAQTVVQAGVKAIVGGAKYKLTAAPVLAGPVVTAPPVVAAPTIPHPPVVPASITNVKVFKSAPPRIAPRPVPVEQWKLSLTKGWDSSLSYGHPLYGYGFTRSAVELRKRREAVSSNAAFDSNGDMTALMLKQLFSYVSGHDSERCVLRGGSRAHPGWTTRQDCGRVHDGFVSGRRQRPMDAIPRRCYRWAGVCQPQPVPCALPVLHEVNRVSRRDGPLAYLTGLRNRRLSHVTARRHAPCARAKIVQVCSRYRCTILTPILNFIEE